MITIANIRDAGVLAAIKAGNPRYVYCGRAVPSKGLAASKWANPFRITKERDRDAAIASYYDYVRFRPSLMADLPELRDKVLVCWCHPERCHCEVLKALAEAYSK